ncbi:hypothetical protein SSX86_011945 [Deinandra increscens subsp. villosa]|uniref:Protein kinase domain-containing protein n=1 Tax=Deinandra increscens subsp. villosa TaxID=3103831 RepID=A0AAP0D3N0_9ASTR
MDAFLQTFLQQFQHLKIQLEEITLATNNFDDQNNRIGVGGFGKVYKGEVTHSKGRSMVAIKRLDSRGGQGIPEFLKEITMLSNYQHENLVSLLGFCCEGSEMILVYELASHGSLDRHLNSHHLTWMQRLKICLDVARGLGYLHDPRETHQRLIHCDMKSGNILLDDKWNAKVSDFGLSIMGSANEQHSVIITLAAGTRGYCDPQYAMTHTLTKESDVYSFGVVLFEVLCGRLCCTYSINGDVEKKFVPTWIESYEHKNLNDIIFKSLTIQPLDQSALETFSNIAYRCLNVSREVRPNMAEVVIELETALEYQDISERILLFDYEKLSRTAEPPLSYSSNGELMKLLSKGVLLNGGKTWFSLNKKGEHCEMISFAECIDSKFDRYKWSSYNNSRFAVGTYHYHDGCVKTRVKTQFLSPGITYKVNFVFNFIGRRDTQKCHDFISLKYKLQGETKTSISYLAVERQDGWYMAELYQFTSDQRIFDLEILFEGFYDIYRNITVEGIEFWPLEKVEHRDEKHPLSDSDVNWEKKLPTDYEDIIKWSTSSVHWTTKKEAYSVICKGFLINDGEKWFSLDKNGKKCHMTSARVAGKFGKDGYLLSLPESRFGEAIELGDWNFEINYEIMSQLVSSDTTYASYLVYKLPKDQSGYEAPLHVMDGPNDGWYIYLTSPRTPVIRPKADQDTHNPLNCPRLKGFAQQRNDGWMEVQIWEFRTTTTSHAIRHHLFLSSANFKMLLSGLIIEGIEFRPI